MRTVCVAGGGPAGLAAAIFAAKAGARAVVLEHNEQCGVKLLATGGGHCNLSNLRPPAEWPALFGRHGRFILPAMRFMDHAALVDWLASLGVPTAHPDGFHLYPVSKSAKQVRDALVAEALRLGVDLHCRREARSPILDGDRLRGIETDAGAALCDAAVIAMGGRAMPASGSTGDGAVFAARCGLRVRPCLPGLVGLRADNLDPDLAGLTLPDSLAALRVPGRGRVEGRGDLLLTHAGLSGPAVLDLSASVAELLGESGNAVELTIRWLAGIDKDGWEQRLRQWRKESGASRLAVLLRDFLPQRLARWLVEYAGMDAETVAARAEARHCDALSTALGAFPAAIAATEGWNKAMITRGGVHLADIRPGTLASRAVANLHFAGETLNLDGPCGGYNLHWALASGALAGHSAARADNP